MFVSVVDLFEVIEIEEDQVVFVIVFFGMMDFFGQMLVEVVIVVEVGEVVVFGYFVVVVCVEYVL